MRQADGQGGVPGGAQGVGPHVGDTRRLGRGSCGRHGGGAVHVPRGTTGDEPACDLPGRAELATSERPGARDGVPRAVVVRRLGLDQVEHALRAVCRPQGDGPTVWLAERLR